MQFETCSVCSVSGDLFWLLLQSWLGLEAVDRAALWALFFAWGISVIQVLLVCICTIQFACSGRWKVRCHVSGCVSSRCTGRHRTPLSTAGVLSQMMRCQVSCWDSPPPVTELVVCGRACSWVVPHNMSGSAVIFLSHCRPVPAALRRWHQGAAAGKPCGWRCRFASTREPPAGQCCQRGSLEQRPRPPAVGAAGV
jgi:hypothetical protein